MWTLFPECLVFEKLIFNVNMQEQLKITFLEYTTVRFENSEMCSDKRGFERFLHDYQGFSEDCK